jgi:hypothetical protein
VPALAAGLAFDGFAWIRVSAWALLAAAALDTVQFAWIARHAFGVPGRTAGVGNVAGETGG